MCSQSVSDHKYMADQLAINGKRSVNPIWPDIVGWSQIVTPMIAEEWDRQLRLHPDRSYQDYFVRSLREGFGIGFSHESAKCTNAVS